VNLKVRLFASFRQAVGVGQVDLQLGDQPRVGDLLAVLRREYPALGPAADSAMVAVNLEYVGPDYRLEPGDEVAIIPPVSGGAA
jgi:molybdopterin converting factor subunit 1